MVAEWFRTVSANCFYSPFKTESKDGKTRSDEVCGTGRPGDGGRRHAEGCGGGGMLPHEGTLLQQDDGDISPRSGGPGRGGGDGGDALLPRVRVPGDAAQPAPLRGGPADDGAAAAELRGVPPRRGRGVQGAGVLAAAAGRARGVPLRGGAVGLAGRRGQIPEPRDGL